MANINRTATTALNVTTEGAERGAAQFEAVANRIKQANAAAASSAARASKALEAVGHASDRAAKAQGAAATAQARAARVAAETGVSADKVAKANDAVARAAERVKKATESLAAAEVRATTATTAATAAKEKAAKVEELAAKGAERFDTIVGQQTKRLERLRAELDPVGEATKRFADKQAFLDAQFQAGKLGPEEHADLLRKLKAKYEDAGEGASDAANANRKFGRSLQQLSPQISDIVTQIGSGTSATTVLIQQGPQIADIFGGIPTLIGKIPPAVRLAVAGFVALAVATAVIASKMSQVSTETRRLEVLAGALNPKLKGMSAELRELTDAMVAGGASREKAVETIEMLARIRGLDPKFLKDISGLSVDLAALYGGDPNEWAKKLAEAAQKGAAGMRELDKELGRFGSEELAEMDRQERLGHRTELLRLAFDSLNKQLAGKGREMASEWANAFHDMGVAFDGLVEKIGKTSFFQGFKEQALAELAGITAIISGDYWKDPGKYTPAIPRAAPTAEPAPSPGAGRATPTTDARIAQLNDLTQRMKSLRDQTNAATAEATRLSEAGEKIGAVAATKEEIEAAWRRAGELQQQFQEVENQARTLRKEIAAKPKATLDTLPPEPRDSRGLTDDQRKEVDPQWDRYRRETAAMKENQVQRQILLAGIAAYDAAIERGAGDAVATQEKLIAEATARRDLTTAIRDQTSAAELDIKNTLAIADAYRVSTEAGMKAEAMAQALAEAQTTGADASARASQILRKNSADASRQIGADLNKLKADNDNLKAILKGAQEGPAAAEAARRKVEANEAFRPAIQSAELAGDTARVASLKAERTEMEQNLKVRDDYSRAIATAAQFRQGYEDDLELIKLEERLVGATNEERDREIGLLQLRQQLIAAGYTGKELEDELNRLKGIVEQRARLTEATRKNTEAFERNKAAVMDSVDIMHDGFEDLVFQGESFNDVLDNMSKAFLKLGTDILVMEPLKRWLNTTMNATASSGGGFDIGSLLMGIGNAAMGAWGGLSGGATAATGVTTATAGGFGGAPVMPVAAVQLHGGGVVGHDPAPVRTVPPSVFVQAPRLHSGMRPGEYGAILEQGEEVLTARNPRHRRNFRGGGAPVINMTINTPDAQSFRASQQQVGATASRALQMAMRRNG